jgi:hypothetical protein
VASSAERAFIPTSGAIALAVAVSGCVSTQLKAARARVTNARIIASQSPTIVHRRGREVRVTATALLRDGGRVAIVVRVHNTTPHPVNDIPMSVGLLGRGGARTYLNRAANLDYFKTHVAEIPAGATESWVFTGRPRAGLAGRPFAVAGSQATPAITVARSIPSVRVAVTAGLRLAGDRSLRVTVTNLSSVPQVELQLYAVALTGRHYSAAGSASVGELGTGKSTTLSLGLVGRRRGATVQVEALPTLFR